MSALPDRFEALEPFVARWALEGSANRADRRGSSTAGERQALFSALQPVLGSALELLDATPLAKYDDAQRNLMNLCLALAHVAPAIESQGEDEEKHTLNRNKMRITRAPSDQPAT